MRLATIGFSILLTLGCQSILSTGEEITLPVSAVSVPGQVSGNRFTVGLTVVTGGCRKFDRVTSTRTPASVNLEARGTDSSGPGISCTTEIRYEEHTYDVEGPFSDPFTVNVSQPDGTVTTRTVRIQ